jgi:hypothetical protein
MVCDGPIALDGQEWLFLGQPISHVVVAREGSPARIVAPDPGYFALQKLWMAEKPGRSELKKPKDARQGAALLSAIRQTMPHFLMDDTFENQLSEELLPHFRRWKTNVADEPPMKLQW